MSRIKRHGTDGSLLSSLPWTLASLALALLPHVIYLPVWISAAFLACGLWRYMIEKRRAALPSTWIRAALALACFLGVLFEYQTISGVGPGSALLAIMASLKLLETRKRRDQFVLLFIAIFLVMSALLREQYLWSLPYLVVAMIFIMTAWLRMSAAESESIRRSFATGGRLLLYAAPIAIVMWVFFPRISSPFWAVPIDTSSGVSGLSSTMSPGDISSLSLSNEVAFRVRFDSQIPAARDLYWRGLVLHQFNGRSWKGSEPSMGRRAAQQIEVRGEPVRYRITMEATRQHWVYALDIPYQWDLHKTRMSAQQVLARDFPIDQRIAYQVESYTDYRAEADMNDFVRDRYLALPDSSNRRTAELARQMRRDAGSDGAYINALLALFHDEDFYYTLQPPPLGRNPVDNFLFDTRRGFCEHYASAFTVMMRSAGIPARIVLGYQGGELNPLGNYMIVRQSDAHAWAEVWFAGRGWVRVDPTAAVAPERIELGIAESMFDGIGLEWGLSAPSKFLHQMQLRWDAMNAQWNDWVLGYGPEKQNAFMALLGMDNPSWRKMLLTLITLVIGMILLISGILALRYRPPPPDRATILYRRFVAKTGHQLSIGESPAAFAMRASSGSRLSADTILDITNSYQEARYGGVDALALQRLETQVAAIR